MSEPSTAALLIDAVVQFQKHNWRAETTRRGLACKQQKAQRYGTIPYGFELAKNGIDLVENKTEQEVLRLVAELRQSGWSLRQIANELNKRSIKTKNGKPWVHSTINGWVRGIDHEGQVQ